MASKGKGKGKLKKTEVYYGSQHIDLRCLAYDIFVIAATRFQVPKSCIPVWEDLDNDNVYDTFLLAMWRLCFRYQIPRRYDCYKAFELHYEPKKFSSWQGITCSLQLILSDIVDKSTSIIDEVIVTLAVINEFILYLYSKNCNLYLIELGKFWCQYVQPNKDKFEKAGGLNTLYRMGTKFQVTYVDEFYDTFIPLFCVPYEKAAKNPHLLDIYNRLVKKFLQNKWKTITPEECRELLKPEEIEYLVLPGYRSIMPQTSARKESSRIDPTENTGLGIRPHEELLRDIIPDDTASSQNLPEAHPQECPRWRRRESIKQKALAAEASSQNLPEANPQELTARRRRPSAQQKAKTSLREDSAGIDIDENTGLGICPHEDILRDLGASAAEASSQNVPETNPQEPIGRRRRPSGASTSVEDHFKRLNLRSPGAIGSIVENPDDSTGDDGTSLQNPSGEDPQ